MTVTRKVSAKLDSDGYDSISHDPIKHDPISLDSISYDSNDNQSASAVSHRNDSLSQVPVLNATHTVPVSIITTCHGRNRHLYNQLLSLASARVKPAQVIIVSDDADPDQLADFDLNIVQVATAQSVQHCNNAHEDVTKSGFDIGRNRNIGAQHASHQALIFLDVDCIVSYSFVQLLYQHMKAHPKALIMGQPRYLQRPLTSNESTNLAYLDKAGTWLTQLSTFNPWRQNLTDIAITQTQDYGGFWSLCFAIHQAQFDAIGGFDTRYIGYGAEDTDFGFSARKLGIHFYLTNAVVFHQQHGVYRPPLNHLDSIIINANIFYAKWQHWPMSGWLEAFANMGLIDWTAQQSHSIKRCRAPTPTEINDAHFADAPFV